MKKRIKFFICAFMAAIISLSGTTLNAGAADNFIKWVDLNIPCEIMNRAYELDSNSRRGEIHLNFVEMLAYVTAQNGNMFSINRDIKTLENFAAKLKAGQSLDSIVTIRKYYDYYYEAYSAIFAEFLGWYKTDKSEELQYGLTAYFPFANGYWHSGGDDFGNSRNFGFKRIHLGHDLFGSVGTPIIAVEGGIVTELGWNRYGGWRIGIRSFDNLRYYYYAHLRKDKPYIEGLEKGAVIEAGQVIGYLGITGYSSKENKNMKAKPHLHFGLQLIFDKSQEDGNGEIWVDVYQVCRFLAKNRATVKKGNNNDFYSVNIRKAIKL